MEYFFTSDTHFGHKNILKHANRPFKSIDHMNEEIIARWNSKVSQDDVVFHLGDFCLTSGSSIYKKFMDRLNGRIVWIQGNHDKKTIIQDVIIDYGGHHWHLAHKPQDCFGEYNICGHIHNQWKVNIQKNNRVFVNVGVDQWDFYPITIKQINDAVRKEKEKLNSLKPLDTRTENL